AHGPSRPNGVIAVTVARGWARWISAGGKDSASWLPRDQITASAPDSSSSTKSRSSGPATTLRLPPARKLKSAPPARRSTSAPASDSAPALEADQDRIGSPCGGSTLMTSAPPSASSLVQYAPAIPVDRSTTTYPYNGRAGSTRAHSFARFDLLSRNSGGNLMSLSLTASASPLSMASCMSRSSVSSLTAPLPIDSKKALSRL